MKTHLALSTFLLLFLRSSFGVEKNGNLRRFIPTESKKIPVPTDPLPVIPNGLQDVGKIPVIGNLLPLTTSIPNVLPVDAKVLTTLVPSMIPIGLPAVSAVPPINNVINLINVVPAKNDLANALPTKLPVGIPNFVPTGRSNLEKIPGDPTNMVSAGNLTENMPIVEGHEDLLKNKTTSNVIPVIQNQIAPTGTIINNILPTSISQNLNVMPNSTGNANLESKQNVEINATSANIETVTSTTQKSDFQNMPTPSDFEIAMMSRANLTLEHYNESIKPTAMPSEPPNGDFQNITDLNGSLNSNLTSGSEFTDTASNVLPAPPDESIIPTSTPDNNPKNYNITNVISVQMPAGSAHQPSSISLTSVITFGGGVSNQQHWKPAASIADPSVNFPTVVVPPEAGSENDSKTYVDVERSSVDANTSLPISNISSEGVRSFETYAENATNTPPSFETTFKNSPPIVTIKTVINISMSGYTENNGNAFTFSFATPNNETNPIEPKTLEPYLPSDISNITVPQLEPLDLSFTTFMPYVTTNTSNAILPFDSAPTTAETKDILVFPLNNDTLPVMNESSIVCENNGTSANGTCTCRPGYSGKFCESFYPENCADYAANRIDPPVGVKSIFVFTGNEKYYTLDVFCEYDSTIILSHFDNSLSFAKTWTEYENGFGKLPDVNSNETIWNKNNFWIGTKHLHYLTSNQKTQMALKVEFLKCSASWLSTTYKLIQVGGPETNYTINLSGYETGQNKDQQAGDITKYVNGAQFSTFDHDSTQGCSAAYDKSGFWFNPNFCKDSKVTVPNLHGIYPSKSCQQTNGASGVLWSPLTGSNKWSHSNLQYALMQLIPTARLPKE